MKLHVDPRLSDAVNLVAEAIDRDSTAREILAGETLEVGMAGDPEYGFIPGHARTHAVGVGDAGMIADAPVATEEIKALFKRDPSAIDQYFKWNERIGRYEVLYHKKGMGVGDAAPDLIALQTFATPGLVNYFGNIFKKPLLYSHARDLVSIEAGSNPWARVMTLYLANYIGFAVLGPAGSPDNNQVQDVNAQAGMISAPIINMRVSHSISVEELEASKESGMPFGSLMIQQKKLYGDYSLEMLFDYLVYHGNQATGTDGLFSINAIQEWDSESMFEIADPNHHPASTTKGSDIYQHLAKLISDFMTASYNKFTKIRVAMSPQLMNIISRVPYSDVYDPTAAKKIFLENFMAGLTKDGKTPDIDFLSDPLLQENTLFNTNDFDYLVITAPEIPAGPDETSQKLLLAGTPIMKFAYPTIAGQYNTQYTFLRRYAGVFAPVPAAVKVVSGFGYHST